MVPLPSAALHEELAPFVRMALAAIHREFPYHLTTVLAADTGPRRPRDLTPAFFGAYDWHSAVHTHWALVRAARVAPDAPWATQARAAVARTLSPAALEAERAHLEAEPTFERPYGLAWLLQLAAELATWDDPDARAWLAPLAPLATLAAERLESWFDRLPAPVRAGEHSQSAFAMGLLVDWAHDRGQSERARRAGERAVRQHAADRAAPVHFEPSGSDFLSPILASADLLRRAMPPEAYGPWLTALLPAPGSEALARWLAPVVSPDPSDGKLAHLDGLNLSRAWMLDGIVAALSGAHPLRPALVAAAGAHRRAGLASAASTHYMGTHWLGSFAIYLLTGRGLG